MPDGKPKTRWYWPKITDIESARVATKLGFWAAVIVAAVTTVFATIAVLNHSEFAHFDGWSYVDVILFAIIAWRIKRFSRIFAVIGVLLFVLEKALMIGEMRSAGNWIMAIALLLMFINGARGVFAYHRFIAADVPEPAKP